MNDRIVDWPVFLRRQDMHFADLPRRWEESPHFGNAMIGSMLYQVDDALRLQVFRADVHDHRDDSFGWIAYSRPRFMIGHFEIKTTGQLVGCSWRKDLWNAELTGTIQTERGRINIRHYVHAVDMAIVTELAPIDGEAIPTWTWHPSPATTSRPGYPTDQDSLEKFAKRYGEHYLKTLQPLVPNPEGRLSQSEGVSVWSQNLKFGGGYAVAWAADQSGGTQTHVATIANSFPDDVAAQTAVAYIQLVRTLPRGGWVDEHRQWWHGYYRKSFVSIPDAQIEAKYWQTVYRLGCTSRAGRFYVDTAGLWFQGGSWPYTTNDWNTQSAHWGVYSANRLAQGEDIVSRLHRYSDNLIEAVYPKEWRADSAYLTICTVGDLAGSRIGDMRYHELVGNLPWLLHNAWWQYRYSMDERILRDTVFPLLRRAVNLYFHLCEDGPDGRLHLQATYSPETGIYRDCNFDLSLFKWGCHILLKSAKILGISDPLAQRWQEVIDRLIDFPTDARGFKLAAGESAPIYHRHLSHLLMMYPLFLVNIDQPGRRQMLIDNYRLVHLTNRQVDQPNQFELHAMIQTHAAPIGCAVGQGDMALEGLGRLIAELAPNGLWPPVGGNPCIESTLSIMSIVQDMLIQSWSDPAGGVAGPIRVFPAVPSGWLDVEFHDLRAEGAFLVSSKRQAGKTRWVRIESLAGEPFSIRLDSDAPVQAHGGRKFEVRMRSAGVYEIDLRRGETVELVLNHP